MEKYGLIGYPLGHSFSKEFFNRKFSDEKREAVYLNFEIPSIEKFTEIIDSNPELKGLNVTIPYKQQIIPFLNALDTDAKNIGAVNVIKFSHNEKGERQLTGFNSDIIGFKESIRPLLNPSHQKALILGTGGASKAVKHGLEQLGLTPTFVSRTAKEGQLTYADLTEKIMTTHTVIVNTTPLGMFPKVDNCPDIPYEMLTPHHLLFDLVYNPDETLFMKKGKAYGAVTKNGLEMLHLQAVAAWKIWQQ